MNVEVTEFSGPQRSLLVINGGSATAVAWKWGSQEAGETHVWVCVALTTGVCFENGVPLDTYCPHWTRRPPGHLLPPSDAGSPVGEELKLLRIAMVFGTCSFQGINGIRNEILALISHICWVLSP